MPADCYRNQYLIICSITHPLHRLISRELPATNISSPMPTDHNSTITPTAKSIFNQKLLCLNAPKVIPLLATHTKQALNNKSCFLAQRQQTADSSPIHA